MFSTELSEAEVERLALLMEEASEVVKACAKILRHGYESSNPNYTGTTDPGPTNREDLTEEIGHVYNAVNLMYDKGDIDDEEAMIASKAKSKQIGQFLHFQY